MTCEQLDELLAAFAHSALGPEESDAVQEHLDSCHRHDDALATYRRVIERLPALADEREPSFGLRARVLDEIEADVKAPAAAPRPPSRSISLVRRPFVAYLAAAALFLGTLGMLAWNLTLQLAGESSSQTITAALSGRGGTGEMVYSSAQHLGVLKLDLPGLPSDRAYQAWQIVPNGPVSLGIVSADQPSAFAADLSSASAVAVTEEPLGGSPQPTTAPILIAQIP